MGEYIIYYRGKIVGGIYDDRFLVKPTQSAKTLMPEADLELPYEGAKEMFLEYDDERSGGFKPLEIVSKDKKVVLGLITTKSPELESKDKIIARILEAAKYIPLERLSLSPQCGFASCEIGNKLTEEQQWAKLRLVKEIADEVWK